MTQQCEKILNAAERIIHEKHRQAGKLSYHSPEQWEGEGAEAHEALFKEFEEELAQFSSDLTEIQEEHKQNSLEWSQWQLDQSSNIVASKDLAENIRK